MAVTLAQVKVYLRIDDTYTAEDDLLTACLNNAVSYLSSAVYKFDDYYDSVNGDSAFIYKADIVIMSLVSEMYRNRDPSNDNRDDYPFCIRSQISQLQNWVEDEP